MRYDNPKFASAERSTDKRPQFVVNIVFDVGSLYFTSHTGISGVPGTVIDGVVEGVDAVSQRIVPDEGRSEIGSMSFRLVDRSSAVTTEFRSKLASSYGLRGKTVRLYRGYEGFAWSEFSLFQTQVIRDAEFDFGSYIIECSDITREQRKDIFEPKATTLRLSCTETDTVISVYDTTAFLTIEHGTSYSDAPSATVGYIKIQDEVIRWTGKNADSFIGCTRGALNTRAKAHTVDATTAADQRTKVEEVFYLEMPAAKLAYAINTGVLHGQSGTLPSHWHLGISTSLVRLADFTGIGPDLWSTADDTKGFIMRFAQEKAQDGKAFLEKAVYSPMGCFSPIYANGQIGLRRMAALTSDAAAVATLTEREVVSHSGLAHDMSGMINDFQIDWSYDGKESRRRSRFVDQNSVTVHGRAPLKKLEWRGVYGSRHTDITIWQRLFAMRDRYSAPPVRLQASLLPSMSSLEVGDVVRVNVANLRDYTGATATISRSFEIQRISLNHSTGDMDVDLFGSTSRPSTTPPADITAFPLPDAYYTSEGTNLSAVSGVTIASGVMTAAPGTPIGGNADLTNSGAIFYYDGDLTIQNGVTLKIQHNVQLRIKGYLTINGTIDGNYAGLAGVADDGAVTPYLNGNAGFVGNSRGLDGLRVTEMGGNPQLESQPIPTTQGKFDAFPFLTLSVSGNSLLGLPTDLRGTGGGPGGKVVYQSSLRANGGTGGAGGAGLAIIARGLTFGASAQITLRGANTTSPSAWLEEGKNFFPGTGGAGGPGALLILMDTGPSVAVPDLTSKFYGVCGTVANPYYSAEFPVFYMPSRAHQRRNRSEQPYAGYQGPEIISGLDLSNAAHRIQYVPPTIVPSSDVEDLIAPPTDYTATSGPGYILLRFTPPAIAGVTTEIYASADETLANASLVGEVSGTQFYHALLTTSQRFYFFRSKKILDENTIVYSEYVPGSTSLITSTPGGVTSVDVPEQDQFLERFEQTNILDRYDSVYGSGTITTPLGDGTFGGRVLQVAGGSRALIFGDNIPIDPLGLYRATVRLRQTVAPTSSITDGVYLGFRGIAADGVTPVYASGSDHYPVAANLDMGLSLLGSWVTVVGYFTGSPGTVISPAPDVNVPSRVAAGVVYIRPIIYANYIDGNGTQQFDYYRIEKYVGGRWQDIVGAGKPTDYADNTAANAPAVTGVWYERFEHQNWPLYYNNRANAATLAVDYPLTGEDGGRVLRAQNQVWLAWKENIPYDATALYIMTVRVRRVAAATTGGQLFYCGVEGFAGNGVTPVSTTGANSYSGQHYLCANGVDLSGVALGTWATYTGYFTGNGTPNLTTTITTPTALYTGVRYFRPLVIGNYSSGDGTIEIDAITIDRLVRVTTGLIDLNAVSNVSSATLTGPSTLSIVGGAGIVSGEYAQVSITPSVDCTAVLRVMADVKCTDAAVVGHFGNAYARIERSTSPFTSYASVAQVVEKQTTDDVVVRVSAEFTASLLAGVPYDAHFLLSLLDFGVIDYDVSVSAVSTVLVLYKR